MIKFNNWARQNATTGTTKPIEFRRDGATPVGSITMTNSVVSFNTTSDYRLKDEIRPLQNSLDKVLALRPSSFRFKSDGSVVDGFIAHEVQEVAPYAVIGEKDAVDEDGNPTYQTLDYSKLTPLLAGSIHDLAARFDRLEEETMYWKIMSFALILTNLGFLAGFAASRASKKKTVA